MRGCTENYMLSWLDTTVSAMRRRRVCTNTTTSDETDRCFQYQYLKHFFISNSNTSSSTTLLHQHIIDINCNCKFHLIPFNSIQFHPIPIQYLQYHRAGAQGPESGAVQQREHGVVDVRRPAAGGWAAAPQLAQERAGLHGPQAAVAGGKGFWWEEQAGHRQSVLLSDDDELPAVLVPGRGPPEEGDTAGSEQHAGDFRAGGRLHGHPGKRERAGSVRGVSDVALCKHACRLLNRNVMLRRMRNRNVIKV